ncbi:hypothetical protein FA95DRAFT_314420 [Auriscalpium vulgare]|uniref:Uncharacterized protein n=1 Tax=Auriscalpium vulgare TaxID=40419 RepID=A0ACB8S626_9AGAM|nr:hypothetical protein FA95DRAFT_314420 [Auriscalpium vulgare]
MASLTQLCLNDCALLFIPSDDFRANFITSVYVYAASPHQRPADVQQRYNAVQATVSELLLKLATQHTRKPFPQHVFPLILEGEGYKLHIVLKGWEYGQTIELAWGGQTLVPTEEKWSVLFEVCD